MFIASSMALITYDGPGPTQYFTMVVIVAVKVLYADSPDTVNVLPSFAVLVAREPGNSLPFDMVTLLLPKAIVSNVPSAFVIFNVEFAPSLSA